MYISNILTLFAEDLKSKLENYITRFDGKVRLIRNDQREGLIRTRSIGAKESRGDVVVFLGKKKFIQGKRC